MGSEIIPVVEIYGAHDAKTIRYNTKFIIIEARLLSMSWQIGSVISTRLSKNDCKSTKKSCLKRVIFEASGTLVKPQNSLRCLENAERLAKEILLE